MGYSPHNKTIHSVSEAKFNPLSGSGLKVLQSQRGSFVSTQTEIFGKLNWEKYLEDVVKTPSLGNQPPDNNERRVDLENENENESKASDDSLEREELGDNSESEIKETEIPDQIDIPVVDPPCESPVDHSVENRRSTRTRPPSLKCIENAMHNVSSKSVPIFEPETYPIAATCKQSLRWMSAVSDEFKAFKTNSVAQVIDRTPDMKTVGTRWCFKIKLNDKGEIDRYKARLTMQGFSQIFGVNYEQTFAPTPRMESILLVLGIVASKDLEDFQGDVETAFLNPKIDFDIFVRLPLGHPQHDDKTPLVSGHVRHEAAAVWQHRGSRGRHRRHVVAGCLVRRAAGSDARLG